MHLQSGRLSGEIDIALPDAVIQQNYGEDDTESNLALVTTDKLDEDGGERDQRDIPKMSYYDIMGIPFGAGSKYEKTVFRPPFINGKASGGCFSFWEKGHYPPVFEPLVPLF